MPSNVVGMMKSFSDLKKSPCQEERGLTNLFFFLINSRTLLNVDGLFLEVRIVVNLDKGE